MANNILVECACGCGKLLSSIDKKGRPRKFIHNHHFSRPLVERFWEKVEKTEGCWEWTGATNNDTKSGSGKRGYIGVGNKVKRASRVAWELTYGEIPDNLFVCHHCDNSLCVRPDHLFLGTHKENMNDRDAKGRVAHGAKHGWAKHPELVLRGSATGSAKFTEEQVLEIRKLYKQGVSQKELVDKYNAGRSTIHAIVHRRTWKHIN